MISEKYQNRKNRTEKLVADSNLAQEEKDELIDILNSTLEGTNGLTPEEKLQSTTESVFSLTRLMVSHVVKESEAKSWKTVVQKCKREIMWVLLGFFGLLIFHPELGNLVGVVVGK